MSTDIFVSVDAMVNLDESRQLLMIDLPQHGMKVGKASTQLDSLPTCHQTRHKVRGSPPSWRNGTTTASMVLHHWQSPQLGPWSTPSRTSPEFEIRHLPEGATRRKPLSTKQYHFIKGKPRPGGVRKHTTEPYGSDLQRTPNR